MSTNPVKRQKLKQKAFEQSRSAASLIGRLRHRQDSTVGKKGVVLFSREVQKMNGVKGRMDGSVWSGRLRSDSAIAPSQLRSGKKRSNFNKNDVSSTESSRKRVFSPCYEA